MRKIWKILSIVFALEIIAAINGLITKNNISTWYINLNKSNLTPPSYYFGIVWTLIYAILGYIAWLVWQTKNAILKKLYIFQMLLNWLWTPVFFGMHQTQIAVMVLMLLLILVLLLAIKAFRLNKIISFLLIPYLIWLIFAFYLNLYIAINN